MDEFGVLTQKYGLKPQGKSAPMAETKRQQQQQPTKTANSENGSGVDDGNLGFETSTKLDNDGYGANFGGSSFDLESVLGGSSKGDFDDDIFGGMPGLDVSRNGGFSSKESGLVGDLLGGFGGVGDSKDEVERRSGEEGVKPGGVVGDLLGGFGGSGDKWEGMDYTGEREVDRCGEEVKQDGQVDDLLGGFDGSEDKFKGMDGKDEGEVEKSGEDVKRGGPVGDLLGGFGGSGEKWDGTDGKDEKEVMRNADNVKRGGPVGDLLGGFGGSGDKWDGMGGADGTEMKESKVDVKISGATGDLLGGFGGLDEKMEGTDYKDEGDMERSGDRMDDLIPAFGGRSNYVDGENIDEQAQQSTFHSHKPATTSADPFIVFETGSTPGNTAFTDHLDQLGELTSSGVTRPGGLSSSSNSDEAKDAKATYPNLMFDADLYSEGHPKTAQETPSGGSAMAEKPSSNLNFDGIFTDFTAATIREEFEEFEGESEERRSARLARFERIKKREATAVAEMNQRDHQRQQEQEERCRVSEIMDSKIKHWATGKEGNMRALLSSLQDVLWSECGWQPVSLTDLITSAAVKKVYFKATLFVHPDKVQQKGANLQQKYIAEKVFDILKEAYNKFNKEELY